MKEWDGNVEQVDVGDIHFDRKYQRDQHWPLISTIASDPIWPAFGVVICAKREYAGGLLYALDGQQRFNGVLASENPPQKVPVVWFPVKTVAEEAALFDRINTSRKQVAALQVFKARVTAENTTYERIAAAVEEAGYSVGNNNNNSNKSIAAVKGLEAIYNMVGEEGLVVGLRAYREAWPDEDAPSAKFLRGLADVMTDMSANGGLSVGGLVKGMSRTSPGRLERKAEQLAYDQGISKRAALRKAFKALAKI